MNEVELSGILKGDFQDVSNDGVQFILVNRNERNGNTEFEEFICVSYGNAAKFLRQHAESGKRLVVQGRLSSEKLDTENYHTVITVSRVLAVSNSSDGTDYSHASVMGTISCDEVKYVGQKNTAVANLRITNKREYKNREGETFEYTTYLGATAWGPRAEGLEASGFIPATDSPAVVDGLLKPRSYENSDGATINKIDIWVTNIYPLTGTTIASEASAAKKTTRKASPKRAKAEDTPF